MRIRVISPQLQLKTCWNIKETGGGGGSDENATEQFLSFLYPVGDFRWKRVVVQLLVVSDSLQPMDCSTLGFLVLHHLLELAQTHIIDLVMPSNHLILCCPLFLLPSVSLGIRVFPSELGLCIRGPKSWSFSFSISPSSEYSRLISFRIDWFDLLAVQGDCKNPLQDLFKNLLQHHSSKASILRHSAFFMVQLSQYMTTGKTIALTRWTFVGKVMSLLFIMLSRLVIAFLPRSKRLLIHGCSHHLQ